VVLSFANRIALVASLCASIGAAGCGTGVMPGTGANEPIAPFYNSLLPSGEFLMGTHPIATVIWTDPLERQADVVMPANWLSSTIRTFDHTSMYDGFHLDLYRPPPPEAIVEITSAGKDHTELALGEMVLVDDKNDDGVFEINAHGKILPPDEYLGGTATVLIYLAAPFAKSDPSFPLTPQNTTSGYQMVDFTCQGQVFSRSNQAIGATFVPRRSSSLPEIRICNRSHSP
jgi:hypothetical protein